MARAATLVFSFEFWHFLRSYYNATPDVTLRPRCTSDESRRAHTPFTRRACPAIVRKYDVIHKTGSR